MSTSHGYLFSIAMKEDKQSQNNDEASSNYNFDRYQKSKCSGMSYRQLGKTFINVSTMAFRCGVMGGLFGDFKDSLDKLLNEALRNGVNYIDTAYWYGQADPKNFLDNQNNLWRIAASTTKRIAKLTGKAKYIGLALYTLRNIVYVIENTDLKMDVVMTYGRANFCDNSLGEYIQRLKLSRHCEWCTIIDGPSHKQWTTRLASCTITCLSSCLLLQG
ncbi:galactose dehydrogenase, putative [Brugia malayi]|uniref:Galactose dehydrogenase, putative n=2 Tax=Brugia malayi TaxID=6279 RepID=A0A4E9F2Q8_BRUMA|nr:galactose dehydrogenase, putative [Brugia malayi]VIO90923.1 galactose dehydrogenase, putative [Brugia malayi]